MEITTYAVMRGDAGIERLLSLRDAAANLQSASDYVFAYVFAVDNGKARPLTDQEIAALETFEQSTVPKEPPFDASRSRTPAVGHFPLWYVHSTTADRPVEERPF
jgi:hypothetical protein